MTVHSAAAPGAAGTPPTSRLSRLRRALGTALMVTLVALLMEWVTEASLGSEVARHLAARMFVLYDGFFYSRGAEAAAASDRLLVVDVGRPTLQRYRATWPLAYGQHARLLERLRQARPAALFIDFQFESQRDDPSIAALTQTLCAFQADGIPVFLAAGSEASDGRLRPELEELRDAQGQPCFEKVAVGHAPSAIDRMSWTYPLQGEVGGEARPSAALALAEALGQAPLASGHAEGHGGGHGEAPTMGLVWGSTDRHGGPAWIAPEAEPADVPHGEAGTARHYCRAPSWRDLVPLQAFFAHVAGFEPDARPHCPMQASLQALELTAPKTEAQAHDLAARIQGRAVLYGGSFDPNDFITSPLQAELPGVYLHAQATDNLLRFGPDWRHAEIGAGRGHAAEWLLTGAAMLGLALALSLGRALLAAAGARLLVAWPALRGLGQRASVRVQGLGQRLQAPLPGWLRPLWHRAAEELRGLAGRLGRFYVSLSLAVPLCLALEHGLHVAVIGYSSVLAFCLFGELFTAQHEMEEAVHHQAHAPLPGSGPSAADGSRDTPPDTSTTHH